MEKERLQVAGSRVTDGIAIARLKRSDEAFL